jgi:hypothetical protein
MRAVSGRLRAGRLYSASHVLSDILFVLYAVYVAQTTPLVRHECIIGALTIRFLVPAEAPGSC